MDVLSDVLRVVRLTSAVFFTARFSSPWSIESPAPEELARFLGLRAENIAMFHVLVEGECWVSIGDRGPVKMEAGDVLIFPHGDPHVMSSHVGAQPRPIGSLLPSQRSEETPQIDFGGGGASTRFVCGYLHCDQAFNPLIGALPTLMCVSGRGGAERPGVAWVNADGWLAATLRHTVEEALATHPGSSAMLARLTELLYLDVLRRYMQQLPSGHSGWLAGVKDGEVGRALRLLHARPDRPWTVEELAHEVGLSRSALAQRFTELIGEAPMRYLTGWRIQLAKHLLLQTGLPVAEVADRVGYESEAAFNRAFKRHVGTPPVTWRKGLDRNRPRGLPSS